MSIALDIILIGIVLASLFLGYKQGLVKVGSRLFAGIIAIVIALILFKPVSMLVINNTQIDEKIQNVIMERASNYLSSDNKSSTKEGNVYEDFNNKIKNEAIPGQANKLATNIVKVLVSIVLFIFIQIVLIIVFSALEIVAKLPILKQFNELGGLAYGVLRGLLIVLVCCALITVLAKLKPGNKMNYYIQNSYIMNIIYSKIG